MPARFSKPDLLCLILTIAFAGAFIVVGTKQIWPTLQEGTLRSPDEFHSCDLYLEFVAHRSRLAAKLSNGLRALPAEKPIAIVLRDADPDSALLAMLSAYLAWPHSVQLIRTERESLTISRRNFSAIVYCNLPEERSPLPVIALSSKAGAAVAASR